MAKCSLRSTPRRLSTCFARRCASKSTTRRALSTTPSGTSPLPAPSTKSNTLNRNGGSAVAPRQGPLTLLHKTSRLVPQVLEYGPASIRDERPLKAGTWERILSNVYEDLSAATPRPIRLAVYGVDESSGSEDLITALLSNPLASKESEVQVLKDRWKGTSGDNIAISYGRETVVNGNNIELSTPYLQQFSAPVEILELRPQPSSSRNNSRPIPNGALSRLFEADIPIILCNPLLTPVESVLSTPLPRNTIVIVTSTTSQTLNTEKLLSYVLHHSPKPTLLIADPMRASEAIRLLQSSPTTSSVVQRFQDAFSSSNVSAVTRILESLLAHPAEPTSKALPSPLNSLRVKFALARLQDALSHCQTSLSEIKTFLNDAFCDASRLNDQVEEVRARVQLEFLGPTQPSATATPPGSKPRHNEVAESVRMAEGQMKDILSRFSWWKMVLRVDEITTLIASALQQAWCPELERKLLVHTGELHSIQTELTKASFNLLSKHRILPTNVLRNSLLQRETSPQHRLTTNTLTAPIYARKHQIIEYPTARLHLTAQRAVIGMAGGVAGGAGIGWVGWMGWLVGSGEGLFGSLGMEPATAIGIGALGAAASIRWGVGRWERGKRKWWEDWRRVGDGLDRDLRSTLDQCIEQQVGGVARATSTGFKSLIAQREEDIVKLQDEVHRLEGEVKDTVEQPTVDRK